MSSSIENFLEESEVETTRAQELFASTRAAVAEKSRSN